MLYFHAQSTKELFCYIRLSTHQICLVGVSDLLVIFRE